MRRPRGFVIANELFGERRRAFRVTSNDIEARANTSFNRSGISGLGIRKTRMLLELDRRPVNSTVRFSDLLWKGIPMRGLTTIAVFGFLLFASVTSVCRGQGK